jgi:cell division protein FtsL
MALVFFPLRAESAITHFVFSGETPAVAGQRSKKACASNNANIIIHYKNRIRTPLLRLKTKPRLSREKSSNDPKKIIINQDVMKMSNRKLLFKNRFLVAIIFLVVFSVYIFSPKITPYDSRWSIHTSMSIIHEGNTDLNEYKQAIIDNKYYAIETINGHYYTVFPIGVSLLALPFVAISEIIFDPLMESFPALEILFKERLAEYGVQVDDLRFIQIYPAVELVTASFFCALATVFIFLIAQLRLPILYSLVVTFIFAFCTSSWSTSSRALWQHGPSMLMLSISMYLLLLDRKRNFSIHYVAIPLAVAFLLRPTNSISIILVSIYILIFRRKYFLKYLLVSIPFIIFFFSYNYSVYGTFFSNYYMTDRFLISNSFLEALTGNIISPSRGLLIYSPFLLLSFLGFLKCLFSSRITSLEIFFAFIILSHWLLISCFSPWWAGHSYGPRFFADVMPFFIYFLCLFFEPVISLPTPKKLVVFAIIAPLFIFSFYVNYKGAFSRAVYEWNVTPTNINVDPERLWDWHDAQFLR